MFSIPGKQTLYKWLATCPTCPSLLGKTSLFDASEFHDKTGFCNAAYPVILAPYIWGPCF
jgi:hypothetical protein